MTTETSPRDPGRDGASRRRAGHVRRPVCQAGEGFEYGDVFAYVGERRTWV